MPLRFTTREGADRADPGARRPAWTVWRDSSGRGGRAWARPAVSRSDSVFEGELCTCRAGASPCGFTAYAGVEPGDGTVA